MSLIIDGNRDVSHLTIITADLSSPVHSEAIIELLDLYARDEFGGSMPLSEYTKLNLITELQKRNSTTNLSNIVRT